MSDDILYRSKQAQSSLKGLFKLVQVHIAPDNKIALKDGQAYFIMKWIFKLAICITAAWAALQPQDEASFHYVFLAVAVATAINLIITIRYLGNSPIILEIDSVSRQITIYAESILLQRSKHSVSIDDIQAFVVYKYRRYRRKKIYIYLYAIEESGLIHPMMLVHPMTLINPVMLIYPMVFHHYLSDQYAKILGYICNKLTVCVTENEPMWGPLEWNGPQYKPETGKHVDIQKLMSIAVELYDPESTDEPVWVQG
ncbi:MAG: hypothetical protein ACYC27_12995 [Armatimonadota bacterium]